MSTLLGADGRPLPFGLGAIPSPVDERDRLYPPTLDTAAPLPRRYVAPGMGPVNNQGNTGRCTAFALVGMKQWQEKRAALGVITFDFDWLYREEQARDGIPLPHDGSTLRAGLGVLTDVGLRAPGHDPVALWRIRSYHALPFDRESIKRAIYTYGPIVVASRWFRPWFDPVRGILPPPAGAAVGGHAVLRFGWDDDVRTADRAPGAWLDRNSWGSRWGVNGNFYRPFAYDGGGNLHDAWSAVDL